ncbi:MAG: glycosyltransferase family 2 protein, partial [Patescibacteria group bacterium]|nr:glycosyltransferase family 2 protein [Patescibacteria group bacterium]
STPINQFLKLKQEMIDKRVDIVIGSRYLNSSSVKIKQKLFRVWLGRVGNFLIRLFLLDGIKDTQCGFKLFKSHCVKDIFSFQKVKRFGFDMEILLIAKNLGYSILETPVDWYDVGGSRLRPLRDGIITFKDLFYIKLNLWSGRYDRD